MRCRVVSLFVLQYAVPCWFCELGRDTDLSSLVWSGTCCSPSMPDYAEVYREGS